MQRKQVINFLMAIGIGFIAGMILLMICTRLLPLIGLSFSYWKETAALFIIGCSMLARSLF
jgi:zinc transporter ZupT